MQRINTNSLTAALVWCVAGGALLLFAPYYLGTLIASNQWYSLGILIAGILVAALFFMDVRYLVVITALSIIFSASSRLAFLHFEMLRWVFLAELAARGIVDSTFTLSRFRIRMVDVWALSFLGLAFYSHFYSFMPELTLQRSFSLLVFYAAIFLGVSSYVSDEQKVIVCIHDFTKWYFIICLAGFLFSGGSRLSGIFDFPSTVGLFVTLLLPLTLWNYFRDRKKWKLCASVMLVLSLFLSYARAGWVGTAVSTGFFLWFRTRQSKSFVISILLFLGCAGWFLWELFGLPLLEHFLRLESLAGGSGRVEAWEELVRLISYHPWLGYGFGTEDHLFSKFDIVFKEHAGAYAHNSYLGLISQVGILGAALFYLPLFVFVLIRVFHLLSNRGEDESYTLQLALVGCILGALAHGFFESWIYSAGSPTSFMFWTLVAFLYQLNPYTPVTSNPGSHSEVKESRSTVTSQL